MGRNRLDQETSPYLLLHRDNPVHWQPWDEEALGQARREDKPILLSSGYSACHWCHVMAHESFESPETAALMNELFVNIKLDREERPDLDTFYQSALAELGQPRGWPLTMFLTPAGEPFGGGTYFPPTPRYGKPAFGGVLRTMADSYGNDREKVTRDCANLLANLEAEARRQAGGGISIALMNHVAGQLLDSVDIVYGGFGMGAKFPQPMALELLWRAFYRTRHSAMRDAVLLSAEQMCLGGIYDHLGGGFARYTVDEFWLVPHFEKMLYDNALLVDLLTLLWQDTGSPLFAQRVQETVGWVLREMTAPEGGFASSLAADSAGYEGIVAGEGAFYVWHEADIDKVLRNEASLFKEYYDVREGGNWEGMTILNRSNRPIGDDPGLEDRLAKLRAKLFDARERRPKPIRDDKVLADWNGLIIAALANAGASFDRPDWTAASRAAFAFVCDRMTDDNRLFHSFCKGQCKHAAILDDYANMARAALCLLEVTGDASYLEYAEGWVALVDEHYWDREAGGYFLTADDTEAVVTRAKTAHETATPSGNGVMVGVLARLYGLTGKDAYRERAQITSAAFSAEIPASFIAMATLINNSELLEGLVQIVILGDPETQDTQGLRRAVYDTCVPNRLLIQSSPNAPLHAGHPAAGKTQVNGRSTAYVCRGSTCELPVTDPGALRASLGQP